jgi:hypothetical protein
LNGEEMAKKKAPELKLEQVQGKANHHFLCLLEYRRENFLCIIDNITPSTVGAYVLDYAEQEGVIVDRFLSLVTEWFYSKSDNHPLSVEIARRGLTVELAPIYRTFDTTYVSRIVGHAFSFDGMSKTKVRRRRVIPIPEGIAIKLKKTA